MPRSSRPTCANSVTSASATTKTTADCTKPCCRSSRPPDLLIYLRGSVPTLQARIQQRYRANPPARANENRIPADYLQHLNERYDAWVQSFSLAPVFTIPIDSVDLAQSAQFAALVGRIDQWRNVARRAAAPNHTS